MTAPFHSSSAIGFPTHSGTTAASGSGNGVTVRNGYAIGFSNANYTDYHQTAQQTARTAGASGFTRAHLAAHASGNTYAAWLNSSGTAVLRIQSTATATFQLQYWNGATWTAVGSAVAITGGISLQYRWAVDFTGLGTSSGTLRVRAVNDSTDAVVMDESATGLNLTSMVNIDRLRIYAPNSTTTSYFVCEAFIKDGSAVTAFVYGNQITGNGSDIDGTGAYTEVDDTGATITAYDTDFSSLPSSGNRRSYKSAARSFGGRSVKSVGFDARLRCGATGATQCKPYLRIGGTRYYWNSGTAVTLTTTFADYWFAWENDPSTGAAWAATNAESASLEFGIEVV